MLRTVALVLASALLAPASALAGKAFDTESASGRTLVQHLSHEDWRYRHDACEELAERRMVQAVPDIRARVQDDGNSRVRSECWSALRSLAPEELLPVALGMLERDGDAGLRKAALELVEELGTVDAAGVVAGVLTGDKSAGLRRKAAVVLHKRGWWTEARPALERAALEDPDAGVRAEVRGLIAATGDVALRSILHRVALEDPDAEARLEVIERLERSPIAEDRGVLIQALSDPYSHSARHAARALVKLGDASVAPVLRERAMDAADRKVAQELNEAAAKLGG